MTLTILQPIMGEEDRVVWILDIKKIEWFGLLAITHPYQGRGTKAGPAVFDVLFLCFIMNFVSNHHVQERMVIYIRLYFQIVFLRFWNIGPVIHLICGKYNYILFV